MLRGASSQRHQSLGRRVGFVLAFGLVLVGGAGAGETHHARSVPLMLVTSDRGGTKQLYAVSLDGKAFRQLTHARPGKYDVGYDAYPSPDGKRLAYAGNAMTWLVRADGRGRRRLGEGSVVWSADGRALALFSELGPFRILTAGGRLITRSPLEVDQFQDGAWSPTSHSLAFIPAKWSSVIETIRSDGTGRQPARGDATTSVGDSAWTADGQSVAYTRYDLNDPDDISQIYVSRDGGPPVRVAPMKRGAEDVATWSRDGQWLVFERTLDDELSELWLVRPDGSELHRLTSGSFDELATWTPDGDLVFNRDVGSSTALFEIHPDGSGLHRLLAPAGAWGASFSPDGTRFVATVQKGDDRYGIGLFARDGTRLRMLTPIQDTWLPVWSPDGGSIAFVSGGRIALMQPDGTGIRLITDGEHEADDDPAWAGGRIAFDVFPSDEQDGSVLDVLDAKTRTIRTVGRDADSSSPIGWSRQGDAIAYADAYGLNIREVSTGRLLGSASGDFSLADDIHWAPDGRAVLVSTLDWLTAYDRSGQRVWRRSIRDAEPTWSPDGRWAAWDVQPTPRRTRLVLFDARSRRTRILARLGGVVNGVEWSTDSRQLAVGLHSALLPNATDAYLVTRSTGRVRRVTRRFPGGGDDVPEGWLRGPRPPAARPPAVTRVRPRILARGPELLTLSADGNRLAYAFGTRLVRCGALHVRDVGAAHDAFTLWPCGGGNDLSAARAGSNSVAWVLHHSGGGAGNSEEDCLYAIPFGGSAAGIDRRNACGPNDPGGHPLVFEGGVPALAGAGGLLVGGVAEYCYHDKVYCPHYRGFVQALARVDPEGVTPIAHTTKRLDLLDADGSHALALLNHTALVVYDARGGIVRTIRPGGHITDARLDGSGVVVLRAGELERYGISGGVRLAGIRVGGGLDAVRLRDAAGGLAAYTKGAVMHVVRFSDSRDAALWVPGLAEAPELVLAPSGLVVGAQLERRGGIVGLVSQSALAAALAAG